LVVLILSEKDLFPDYEPKRTPDTLQDYLKRRSFVFQILSEIKEPDLKNLNTILIYFNRYKKEVKKHPGEMGKGNVAIGADLDQYYPSEEELLVSELGKMIRTIIEYISEEELKSYKKANRIRTKKISFYEIYFRHVDVMGSGRFFYAEKKPQKTEINF